VSKKRDILFVALLVLLFVAVAGASSAVINSTSLPLFAVSSHSAAQVQLSSSLSQSLHFSDPRLLEIGNELSQPPVLANNSAVSSQIGIKILPAIPATFFMVLTGFLCVSLVRDHKLWRSAAFGLLYLGAAGINAVPQLLSNPENIKIKQSSPKNATMCELKNFVTPDCDAQGTRYVGLLRRMTAIPADESFIENQGKRAIGAYSNMLPNFLHSVPSILHSYLSAIISPYNSRFTLAHIAITTQSRVHPSQVLTSLNHLPHGPPGFV